MYTHTLTQTYILIRLLALFRYLYIFSALLGDLILECVIKLFLSFFLSIFLSWSRTSSPTLGTTFAYSLNISETRFRRAKKICHKTREKSPVPSIDSLVPILSLLILLWDNFVMPVSLMDVIPWNQGLIKESRLKTFPQATDISPAEKKITQHYIIILLAREEVRRSAFDEILEELLYWIRILIFRCI